MNNSIIKEKYEQEKEKALKHIEAKKNYGPLERFCYDIRMLVSKDKGQSQKKAFLGIVVASFILSHLWLRKWIPLWAVLAIPFPIFLLMLSLIAERIYLWYHREYEMFDPETNTTRSETKTFGDREWAGLVEMNKKHYVYESVYECDRFILGRYKNYLIAMGDQPSLHVFMIGYSGATKGTGGIIPNIIQAINAGHSAIVISTKADNYKETVWIARHSKHKHKVRLMCYTEDGIIHSDAIDYLNLIRGKSHPQNTAFAMAYAIVENMPTTSSENFWVGGYVNLLAALLLLFAEKPELLGTDMDGLGGIYSFLAEHSDLTSLTETLDFYIKKGDLAYESYRVFRGTPGKSDTIRNSVIQGLSFGLQALQPGLVKEILAHNEVDLEAPGKEPCIYYVVVEKEYKFLTSLYLTMQIRLLKQYASRQPNEKLPVTTHFIIDELFACGRLPDLVETVDVTRSYGMPFYMCTQSIVQLDELYGENLREDLLNNCGYLILVKTKSKKTAKFFSDLCGPYTALASTKQTGNVPNPEREIEVPLLSESAALNLPTNICVVVPQEGNPMKLEIQKYWDHWPGSRANVINWKDGKCYHAHPLMEGREQISVNRHKPRWRRKQELDEKTMCRELKQMHEEMIEKTSCAKEAWQYHTPEQVAEYSGSEDDRESEDLFKGFTEVV